MATDDNSFLNRIFDGRYLILRRLGSGGMAEVYLAEDQELGRQVALKMLNERHARDEQFVERFKREARNAAGLSHPHIVRIYDRGQAEGTYYIAMEYLKGPTLKELLIRKGPTPPPTAIKFARDILSALAEAHRHEIVHRDIKPHNVIVSPDWQVKVTDFGIARSGASQMTEVGSIVGTAQYLSPEQARGATVDQRSDLYSLGIVLYEMLTGKVPFTGDAAVEIAMKHLSATPDPPSKLRPEIPAELDAVVMRALAKDPDERYSSAEEMDADLARVARGVGVSQRTEDAMTRIRDGGASSALTVAQVPPPSGPPPRSRRAGGPAVDPPHRRSRWPTVLILIALAILAIGGYLIYDKVASTLQGSGTVAVQDVRLLTYDNAALKLKQEGLGVSKRYGPSASVADGLVISQSPAQGVRVKKKTVVTLLVSTGIPKVKVPVILNDSQAAAAAALQAAGLVPNIVKVNSGSVPAGEVTASAPAAGVVVPKGSTVRVNVSLGPAEHGLPNVIGEQYASGASALEGAGFTVARASAPAAVPVGQVTGESPPAGTLEPPGTKVTLTVSTGPRKVPVPSVIGDNAADAVSLLDQQGFKVNVSYQNVTDPTQANLVLSQTPAAGSETTGGTVTITVGSYAAPASTATPPVTTTQTTTTASAATTTAPATTAPATATATTATAPATTTTPPATTSTPPGTTASTPATTLP